MVRIVGLEVSDIRFPTSDGLDGSDAMHADPDYSAAYVCLRTDGDHHGHGFAFTLGRGTHIICLAIEALRPLVVGLNFDEDITTNFAEFWRTLTSDGQLRWLGPEKGVVHMAVGAVVNAVYDLWAKRAGKPLWRLLVDMKPEDIVAMIDFRWISDLLTKEQALEILRAGEEGKEERIRQLETEGYPSYTTSAGWLGYPEDKLRRLCREGLKQGWSVFKMKVGADVEDDKRRLRIVREEIGYDRLMPVDANQRWDVPQAVEWMEKLAEFRPYFIEEPTSPDDVLGHAEIRKRLAPHGIKVATGEVAHNRVMFKQFLQADALDVCQIDACRMGGVSEVLAVLLMCAAKGVPVCPHAGGVGLCEHVQHLAMFDFVSVGRSLEGRMVEYVDHLHEHFLDPCVMKGGKYMAPTMPGYSGEMKQETLREYAYPKGPVWAARLAKKD